MSETPNETAFPGPRMLPRGDYVSPNLRIVRPDAAFPNLQVGDRNACPWQYLRKHIPHNWYVDRRAPGMGFVSRDEASILYNTALLFRDRPALEIGCWLGWSTCHLALGGVRLDVIDPVLKHPQIGPSVEQSLTAAGVRERVNLIAGPSPGWVLQLAVEGDRKWDLIFIDANHDDPFPYHDAIACEPRANADALVLFHDLASPAVGRGLDYFRNRGWRTIVYQTMQMMGAAYRGNVTPPVHYPDPSIEWGPLPEHLRDYAVSPSGAEIKSQ
jgi:predicted O-methyltransferase YrrM